MRYEVTDVHPMANGHHDVVMVMVFSMVRLRFFVLVLHAECPVWYRKYVRAACLLPAASCSCVP